MKPINDSAAEAQNPLSLPIDLSSIYKMTGNDDDMMDIVLDSFMAETEKDLASANDSIRENDGHGLAEALHKLAFRYGQLGVHPLANKLRTMEIDLRNNKDVREIINSLAETQVDIAFVKNAIGELRARKTFLQSVENYNTFQTHS